MLMFFLFTTCIAKIVRILSIDGGGVRGLFPIILLRGIESHFKKPINQIFDHFIGVSAGSLVISLMNYPDKKGKPLYNMSQIEEIYKNLMRKSFVTSFSQRLFSLGGLFDSKYDAQHVEKILKAEIGDLQFKEVLKNVIITSVDLQRGDFFIFDNQDARAEIKNLFLWQIIAASSAAPFIFAPFNLKINNKDFLLTDGAIAGNNPCFLGMCKIMVRYPKGTKFLILSIGTGIESFEIKTTKNGKLQAYDATVVCLRRTQMRLVDLYMETFFNKSTGHKYFRFDFNLEDNIGNFDDSSEENLQKICIFAENMIKSQKFVDMLSFLHQ